MGDLTFPFYLGPYKVVAELGTGGFATVYRAVVEGEMGFSRDVALKVLHGHITRSNPEVVKMLADEARLLARMQHPNIVYVQWFGQLEHPTEGRVFAMMMEYVPGRTLRQVQDHSRREAGGMPVSVALDILLDVARGLKFAHELKVDGEHLRLVHRDLKPDNVIISNEGAVKLLDFGIAKASQRLSDGDGVTACDGDCGPFAPTVFPGGNEICDGLDNDCDQASLDDETDDDGDGFAECGGDCDDTDPDAWPGAPEVAAGPDTNCDGVIGDADADGDGWTVGNGDCDDSNPDVNPDQTELCDAADTDCDGTFLAGELQDADADGFIDCADCNALNPNVNPDAEEICDGFDNDCDGYGVPEGELDLDQDGVMGCAGDCDDGNPYVRPGILENCDDGLDNDCDGTIDQDTDNDGDGRTSCESDCDDNNAQVHPGIAEVCNGIDDNCDLRIDEGFDLDGDGHSICAFDCLDTNATVYPGAPEICNDGVDNDCDPTTQENIDSDGDGFAPCSEPVGDCWEGNPFVHPEAQETCNFVDDDCDGLADEGLDFDLDGWSPCDFDCDDTQPGVNPDELEVCGNGLDDNCDGTVDELECPEDPTPAEPPPPADPTCACESSLVSGSPVDGLLVFALLGLLGARRRRSRHTWWRC